MNSKEKIAIRVNELGQPIQEGRLLAKQAVFSDDFTPEENNAVALRAIHHPFQLAQLVSLSVQLLEEVLNHPDYEVFKLPKKRGGLRTITAPIGMTKKVQYRLNHYFQSYYSSIRPEVAYGFIRASSHDKTSPSIVGNAFVHVGKPHLYTLDLKDYFTSITAKQVYALLKSSLFGFNADIARALTLFVTYKGTLPTGSPTSPVIANFCSITLDQALQQFAQENGLLYSRYADDLTFSSDTLLTAEKREEIHQLIAAHGFKVNPKKERYRHPHQQHRVTGIIVNDKLNVDRTYLKKTRAMLHDLSVNGIAHATSKHFDEKVSSDHDSRCHQFAFRLKGRIDFIAQVRGKEDATAQKMKKDFWEVVEGLRVIK
jgi:RNA-directed DNA polymerase